MRSMDDACRVERSLRAGLLEALVVLVAGMLPVAAQPAEAGAELVEKGAEWVMVAEGFATAEGPAEGPDGHLYFCDLGADRVFRLEEGRGARVFAEGLSGVSGLAFDRGGTLWACLSEGRQVVTIDAKGTAKEAAEGLACNDLAIGPDGRTYVTVPEAAEVWSLALDGSRHLEAEGVGCANGIAFSPDQETMWVADSCGSQLIRLRRKGQRWERSEPCCDLLRRKGMQRASADGLAVDAEGRVWVATLSGVQVLSPDGALLSVLPKPQPAYLSNLAFGGDGNAYLFATSKDRIFRILTRTSGAR